MIERLNDLGIEGWEVVNPEDIARLDAGPWLVLEDVSMPGLFGQKKAQMLKGVKFRMKRTTFSEPSPREKTV